MYLKMRTGRARRRRGRLDVVLLGDVDHRGARDAGDLTRRDRRERDRRQEEVLQRVEKPARSPFKSVSTRSNPVMLAITGEIRRDPSRGRQDMQLRSRRAPAEEAPAGSSASPRRGSPGTAPRLSIHPSLFAAATTPSGTPVAKAMTMVTSTSSKSGGEGFGDIVVDRPLGQERQTEIAVGEPNAKRSYCSVERPDRAPS